MLDPTLDVRNVANPYESFYAELAEKLGMRIRQCGDVYPSALHRFAETRRKFPSRTEPLLFRQIPLREARFVIGLIGRPYILFDPELGGKLFPFFPAERIFLITPEMIRSDLKERALEGLKRPVYWYNGRQNLGAAFTLMRNERCDGLIQVVTFGCGPIP